MFCYMIWFPLKLSIGSSDYKDLYFILHEEHFAIGDTLFLRTIFGLALLWSCWTTWNSLNTLACEELLQQSGDAAWKSSKRDQLNTAVNGVKYI